MDIRPIRNDGDLADAVRQIERLWGAQVGSDDGDKLDILATLVEKYEESRWPADSDAMDPVDMINFAVTDLGHTTAELADLIGSHSRASEVLGRKRQLTVEMIHRISEAWKIPASVLVRPTRELA